MRKQHIVIKVRGPGLLRHWRNNGAMDLRVSLLAQLLVSHAAAFVGDEGSVLMEEDCLRPSEGLVSSTYRSVHCPQLQHANSKCV